MDDDRHVKNGNYLKKLTRTKCKHTTKGQNLYNSIFGPLATTDESLTPKHEAVIDHKHGYRCSTQLENIPS